MTEEEIIVFEIAMNKAIDAYFNARPFLGRSEDAERIFEGGFRMAWDYKSMMRIS